MWGRFAARRRWDEILALAVLQLDRMGIPTSRSRIIGLVSEMRNETGGQMLLKLKRRLLRTASMDESDYVGLVSKLACPVEHKLP